MNQAFREGLSNTRKNWCDGVGDSRSRTRRPKQRSNRLCLYNNDSAAPGPPPLHVRHLSLQDRRLSIVNPIIMPVSARSSKKALTLCLFQSLAGVIFGWGNSEGSGLVSCLHKTVMRTHCLWFSSAWPRTSLVSESARTVFARSAQPDKVPSPVSSVSVLLSVPSVPALSPTR